jgi:hypothetical protein
MVDTSSESGLIRDEPGSKREAAKAAQLNNNQVQGSGNFFAVQNPGLVAGRIGIYNLRGIGKIVRLPIIKIVHFLLSRPKTKAAT